MTPLESVRKRRQQLHARDVRGLAAFCVCLLEEKIVIKSSFPSFLKVQNGFTTISRPDIHAGLFKIYFKPLIKKLKFSTSVAKSDFRFEIHKKWDINNPS